MRIQKICFVGILGLAAAAGAFAASTGQLLADISGGDDHARALARQLLPRQGVGIIPQLTTLLGHEDQAVRKAAFNVLEDLVNMATAPGRFHDRLFATGELLRLLQPGQTPAIKDAALRLLPLLEILVFVRRAGIGGAAFPLLCIDFWDFLGQPLARLVAADPTGIMSGEAGDRVRSVGAGLGFAPEVIEKRIIAALRGETP